MTTELVTEQPDFAMGHALASYLSLSSTDVPDLPGARASASELARLDLTPRETAHQAAIERWVAGDWHGAARALDELLVEWPTDVLALLAGHQLDFFRGDAANLRDRVARSMRRIDPADPVFGFVQGMFAFGLEESGDYQAAERTASPPSKRIATTCGPSTPSRTSTRCKAASTRASRSCAADRRTGARETCSWSTTGGTSRSTSSRPGECKTHSPSTTRRCTTHPPPGCRSRCSTRARCSGASISKAKTPVAGSTPWPTRGRPVPIEEPWYVFNDLHAVVAFAGANRLDDARAVVQRLEHYVEGGGAANRSNIAMTAEIGLPSCRAVIATPKVIRRVS